MLGREQKRLTVRLLKVTHEPVYHIIVTRKRAKPSSRLDRLGSWAPKNTISILRMDIKKLTKFFLLTNLTISLQVWKILTMRCNSKKGN